MNMGNSMHMNILLTFKEAFPDETALRPEEYLNGISRDMILRSASFFLGFKPNDSEFEGNKEFLEMFFRKENDSFANQVYGHIKSIEDKGKVVSIINPYTSLKLFEHFFNMPGGPATQSEAEVERNLFKAYLVLNMDLIDAQEIALSSTKELELPIKMPIWMFCWQYPVSDTTNYDLLETWVTQVAKAIYLFEYLELNLQNKPLLTGFLAYFNSPDWREYLKSLLPLTLPAITNKREAHTDITVPKGVNFNKSCEFVEKLIVEANAGLDENDFLSLRAKPFYKVEDGVYRIIFNLFAVEKIFKGLYFLFRAVNDNLSEEKRIKDFRSFYCHEFSEKILLYRMMGIIYPGKCIRFSGQELADSHIDGAPDYYLRKGKDILLFESKDFLIKASVKASFDYSLYKEEFTKRLYYKISDGKKKPGAVLQLINFIKRLLKKGFSKDVDYRYRDISIYPILITHDIQYDTPGFSQFINRWFQEELDNLEEEGLFIHRIKPLTVINIDSLIFYQIGLAEDIPLHKVIDAYHDHIKFKPRSAFKDFEEYKQQYLEGLKSFALFLNRYFYKLGIHKPPPIMNIVGKSLFNEVWKSKKD